MRRRCALKTEQKPLGANKPVLKPRRLFWNWIISTELKSKLTIFTQQLSIKLSQSPNEHRHQQQ
jgi:hypothetical protein